MALRKQFDLSWLTNPEQHPRSAAWLLLISISLLLSVVRRFFTADFNFVGNNFDMVVRWVPEFRFSRAWQSSGSNPWWNCDLLLGISNLEGPTNPYSALSQLQRFFNSYEKGLDYSLALLTIFCGLGSIWLLRMLGCRPLSALVGGAALAGAGTVASQLYAGHLALYCCLCLIPVLLSLTFLALRKSRIHWCLLPSLVMAAVVCSGSLQGVYIAVWLNSFFFLALCLIGSPEPVQAPTVWTLKSSRRRPGLFYTPVPAVQKRKELAYTALKLILIYLLGGMLSSHFWIPQALHGAPPELLSDPAYTLSHSAPAVSWLTLLIPHVFVGVGSHPNWTGWPHWEGQPGLVSSTLPLMLLAVCGRSRRNLLLPTLLVLAGGLLGLGVKMPLFGLYNRLDPLLGQLEVPSRMLFIANFGLALYMAVGLEHLVDSGWKLEGMDLVLIRRLAWITGTVWVVSFYLDGSQAFWQALLEHLQRGFNYKVDQLVDPQEYYVLLWSRLSAVCILWLAFAYLLLRAPLRFRMAGLSLLILLDILRFNLPFINLRPVTEFLPPAPLVAVIEEKKLEGKVCNLMDASWNGAFGLRLRHSEFGGALADRQPAIGDLLKLAERLDKGFQRDTPSPLYRSLGVGLYVHLPEFLDSQSIRKHFVGCSTFRVDGEDWQLASDPKPRKEIYLSRSAAIGLSQVSLLKGLQSDPRVLESNLNFMDAPNYHQLGQELSGPEFRQAHQLPEQVRERIAVTQRLPNLVEAQCILGAPAMVILNEAWDSDWEVRVDGFKRYCFPCQMGLNRGVLVGPGDHKIQFSYQPLGLLGSRRDSWITLVVSLLLATAVGFWTLLYSRLLATEEGPCSPMSGPNAS